MIRECKDGRIYCKKTDADWYEYPMRYLYSFLNEVYDAANLSRMGDSFCVGNSEEAIYLYSYNTNKKYLLLYGDLKKWGEGEEIVLYPADLDPDDKEYFDEDGYLTN